MSKLHIFTLNWNGEDKLKRLAPTLINSLDGIDYCWSIKDNASSDRSVNYLKSLNNKNINIFEYENNRQNFSEGMNYLFNATSTNDEDLILLLNNDVCFNDTTSISNMISLLKKDKNIGVVGARLLYTDTNKIQHAGVIFSKKVSMPTHFRAKQLSDNNDLENRIFQCVTGAVLLTKASYFKEACKDNKSGICGMDERFHWAFDDVDFCLSIRYNLNKKIVYCGKTNIFHDESASLKKNPSNLLFMNHNANLLKTKWSKRWVLDSDLYLNDPKYNIYKLRKV